MVHMIWYNEIRKYMGIEDRRTRIYILFWFYIAHSVDCLYGLMKLEEYGCRRSGNKFLPSGYCCRNIDFLWINLRCQPLKRFYELSCSHSLVYYTIARMSSFSGRSVCTPGQASCSHVKMGPPINNT